MTQSPLPNEFVSVPKEPTEQEATRMRTMEFPEWPAQWAEFTRRPVVQSLLYDLNLLPEQVRIGSDRWFLMLATISHMAKIAAEQVAASPIAPHPEVGEAPMCCAEALTEAVFRLSKVEASPDLIKPFLTAHDAAQLGLFQAVMFLRGEINQLIAEADQAWDANAERLTREAGICDGNGINMNATTVDELFATTAEAPKAAQEEV